MGGLVVSDIRFSCKPQNESLSIRKTMPSPAPGAARAAPRAPRGSGRPAAVPSLLWCRRLPGSPAWGATLPSEYIA